MFKLQSITDYFTTHGRLRLSQRKTLAALVWALMRKPLLGIATIGRSLATAKTAKAKHAIKRVDRFVGNARIDLEVACGDLIETVIGCAPGLSHPGLDRSEDQRWPVSNPEY